MAKKKKLGGFSELGGFVFSTNEDFKTEETQEKESLQPKDQFLEAHFSNKGRGGKTVTIIKGFEGSNQERKSLCKLLKNQCGVGGSVKDEEIIIQGKVRDKVIEILKKEGFQVKRVGG